MSGLVETFQRVDGATVRVIATLESLDYEIEFVREDLADAYDKTDLDRAYQSMMANQVSTDDFSQVGAFGDLDAQLFLFEKIVVFLFPTSRYDGVFVSYDRVEPFPVTEVVDAAADLPDDPSG